MNTAADFASAIAPPLVTILLQITTLLVAAILIQRVLTHSPAARHAVLLSALTVAGLSPLFVFATRHQGAEPVISLPPQIIPRPLSALYHQPVSTTQTLPSSGGAIHFSLVSSPAVYLLGLWAIGTLIMLFRLVLGLRVVSRIYRGASPLSADAFGSVQSRLQSLLGDDVPRILASDRLSTPVAIGLLHPVVIVPPFLLEQFDERQLLQVLAHECAHAIRRDPLIGLYQRFLSAVFWFHPLIHIANRQLGRAREDLCDNHVLRNAAPADYARTLLAIAESLLPTPDGFLAPTLIRSESELETRIKGFLTKRRCLMTRLTPWKFTAIAAVFTLAGLGLGCFGGPPATQPANNSAASGPLAATMPSAHDQERDNRIKCQSNLRTIGQAISLYCSDSKGNFPINLGALAQWEDVAPQIFICPSSNSASPPDNLTGLTIGAWVNDNTDYIYVGAGMNSSTVDPTAVIAYEKESDHGDGINILFADGHVEFNPLNMARDRIKQSARAATTRRN